MSLKDDLELNTPRRTPGHATKSHVVKTNVNGKPKMIRFGEQGASTAGASSPNDSKKTKAKRKAFKDRHAKNIAKGPASAAYWANKVKWKDGGPVKLLNSPLDSPIGVAKDVTNDLLSGIASPIISSSGWLMDKYFTDYTEDEREARYQSLSDATNYTPRTAGAQFVNETSMQALEDMMGKAATFYGGRTDMLDPEVRQTASAINKAYQSLEPGTRDTIGHALVAGEAFVPFLGKAAGAAKRALSTDTPNLSELVAKYEQNRPSPEEMQANTDAYQQRLIDSGMTAPMMQVKEPGGNFPNIEFESSPESVIEAVINKTFIGYDGQTLNRPGEELVSKWFRNKGKKYITNEMGTGQGDSLVQMFNNLVDVPDPDSFDPALNPLPPVIHFDQADSPAMFTRIPRSTRVDLAAEGRPLTGSVTDNVLGQRYELLTDQEIITTTLEDLSPSDRTELMENQPFYATAPDDTVVHFLKNDQVGTTLGWDIIADELSNMVDPDNLSGLPAELLLSEKNLNKLTLEQASRKVGEARVWRKSEADRVEMKQFTESLNVAYEDPEFVNKSTAKKKDRPTPGMKWVVIDDVSDRTSLKSCNVIGDKGGWCTGQEDYARDYTKGDKFLVAALDNNNQPQAQVALEYVQESNGEMVTDIIEVSPPGNRLDSDKVTVRVKRDPEYLNKVLDSTAKYLNNLNETETLAEVKLDGYAGGMHGGVADIKLLSAGDKIPNNAGLNYRVRTNTPPAATASPSLKIILNDIYMGADFDKADFKKTVIQLLGRPQRVGQELPRFMTKNDVIEFIKENGDEKTAAGLKKNENTVVFVEQVTSMRDELNLLGQGRGPSSDDLMSMTSTDLVAVRTAMRQQLDRVLDDFGNDQEWQALHPNREDLLLTIDSRRTELIEEVTGLRESLGDEFIPFDWWEDKLADGITLTELSELITEGNYMANQRMDAQIDADGLLDELPPGLGAWQAAQEADGIDRIADADLDPNEMLERELQEQARNELMRIQNERGDVDFAYTEDEMLNMSYNDLTEIIDQYNQYPPEVDVLQQILNDFAPAPDNNLNNATLIDAIPVDRTLAEYRELAYTNNFVSEADRLQGFHAMVETSGWDETGEIRVDRTDPLLSDGVWPEEFEELRDDARRAQDEYLDGYAASPDQKINELFLDAPDRTTREWIVNNYNIIRTMLMNGQVPDDRGNIDGFARGGAVTYDPDEIRRLSENLLAGNYYEGGPVTYNHNEIKKLSKQLMETYNV